MVRDYKKEYENYQGKPEQIKRRTARNKARNDALQKGIVKKGDSLDMHHIDGNPLNNNAKNLRAINKSQNRSFKRTKTGRKK